MTRDSGGEAGLVPVQSSALSRVSSTSIALRGAQDFANAERAELFFREGDAYDNHDYAEAIACFMQGLALNPLHIEMRAALGHIYTYSCLELRDYEEGFKHFSIAAELGNADAQSALASMYGHGEGVARNDQLAFFWQKKAAMQGHPCDQRHLGLMYEHGVGVEQDPDQALFWYQKAADQGGYFERSQITELQKRVIGNQVGYYKRPLIGRLLASLGRHCASRPDGIESYRPPSDGQSSAFTPLGGSMYVRLLPASGVSALGGRHCHIASEKHNPCGGNARTW